MPQEQQHGKGQQQQQQQQEGLPEGPPHQIPPPPPEQAQQAQQPPQQQPQPRQGPDPGLRRAQETAAALRAACDVLKCGGPRSSHDDPKFMEMFYK